MKDSSIVWSDEFGDLRKKRQADPFQEEINEKDLLLKIRRLTSGKGRVVIEITGLPDNKKWCKKFIKDLKKKLAVGGAYKNNFIEIHGDKLDQVTAFLNKKLLNWKKIGG